MINVKLLGMDVGVPCYSHLHKNGVETAAVLGVAMTAIGLIASADAQNVANDQNERLHQQDLDYDKWKFQETMNANKMTSQRSDFEAAGYSPYAALGNAVNYGATSTPTGNPMLSTVNPAGFDKMAEMIYGFQNLQADVNKKNSETGLNNSKIVEQNINNETQSTRNIWEIAGLRNNAELLGHKGEVERLNGLMANFTFDARARKFFLDNQLLENQIDSVAADAALNTWNAVIAKKNSEWIDKLNTQSLKESLARIGTEVSKQQLNYSTAKAEVHRALREAAEEKNITINTAQLVRTADDLADGIYFDTQLKKYNAMFGKNQAELERLLVENYPIDKWFDRAGRVIGGVSGLAGGYLLGRKALGKGVTVKGFGQ